MTRRSDSSVCQRRLVLYCRSLQERAAICRAAEGWAAARGLSAHQAVSGYLRFAALVTAGLPLDVEAAARRAKDTARHRISRARAGRQHG